MALCKRCLSKQPEDRPSDAGEVAKAVAALRAAADERARQAELDRVKAEGDKVAAELQAVEQRKRRRVQLVLALLVVVATLAGAGIATALVLEEAPELVEAMDSGALPGSTAAKVACPGLFCETRQISELSSTCRFATRRCV